MNARERYLETLLFGKPDRVPLSPGGPRESTLRAWHQQGLLEGVPWQEQLRDALGIPQEPALPRPGLSVVAELFH